jgi:D-sedoheptulose 7-phosphate isomerase
VSVHRNPFVKVDITGGRFVLIDRDGVISEQRRDYVKSVAELVVRDEALSALVVLRKAGFRVVVLTNQSPVARGIFNEGKLKEIHDALFERVEEAGGRIDRIYFCPHKPEDNCLCRKPKPGLFIKCKEDLDINLEETFYVGDEETDILAARAAGCKAVFVGKATGLAATPDILAENLHDAVVKILGMERQRMKNVTAAVTESIEIKKKILKAEDLLETILKVGEEIVQTFRRGGKVLICGNGGSAADAQHIAAELSGKFYLDRDPLFAEALHVNSSYLTAVANDYSYAEVFARLVRAKGREADVLIGISTSGNSENVIRAIDEANRKGLITVGLTGEGGGGMDGLCKYLVKVPSNDTPRIQEVHITIGHILCEMVERRLFSADG